MENIEQPLISFENSQPGGFDLKNRNNNKLAMENSQPISFEPVAFNQLKGLQFNINKPNLTNFNNVNNDKPQLINLDKCSILNAQKPRLQFDLDKTTVSLDKPQSISVNQQQPAYQPRGLGLTQLNLNVQRTKSQESPKEPSPPKFKTEVGLLLKPRTHVVSRIPRIITSKSAGEEQEIEDLDKSTSRDAVFLVCDIAKDIYEYLFKLEEAQPISYDFLKEQKIFTPKVRQRLTNWCIDIHSQLRLLPETLYLTIAIIDRYFDKVQAKQQNQVQLVAAGACLIASKYEEIYPPDLGDLIHLTHNAYSRRDIMKIEITILEKLNFDLGRPIPLAFLRRFSKAAHCDSKMHAIAKYLMELSICEYECSYWPPSLLAATALFITINLTQQSSPDYGWTRSLAHHTHYTRKQLQEPASILCKLLKKAQKNPQSYNCVKKNQHNLAQWTELKSAKVDRLIKLGELQANTGILLPQQ